MRNVSENKKKTERSERETTTTIRKTITTKYSNDTDNEKTKRVKQVSE